MKTTDIYGLPYIEADDLVSAAPAQFKTMAEGIETALVEVDSRNTPAGVETRHRDHAGGAGRADRRHRPDRLRHRRHDDGEQRPVFLEPAPRGSPYATGGMLDDFAEPTDTGL